MTTGCLSLGVTDRRPAWDGELADYFRQIARYRLLTPAEELQLAKRLERGDASAKERLIESNLRLVVALAKGYRGSGVPLSDLVQEGTLGLIRAIERFDWRRGCKLSTYAAWWIRHALQSAVARQARAISVPRHVLDRQRRLTRAAGDLESALGRTATADELAEATGISRGQLEDALLRTRSTLSLDRELTPGEDEELGDLIADPTSLRGFTELERAEREHLLREALDTLPELQRRVLELRFGFEDEPLSFTEIAERTGLAAETVRSLHRRGLRRLHQALDEDSRAALVAA